MTTFSLACRLQAREEVSAPLIMKIIIIKAYELYESLGHVFLDVRSKWDERTLMLSHCAKADKKNMNHGAI